MRPRPGSDRRGDERRRRQRRALLRARPDAIGVTLRLWLDPAGPDSERACCSPDAVIRARRTCHALGLPHVTLDLREAFRDAVVRSFVAGYEAGVTPNPCMRCNGVVPLRRAGRFARPGRRRRALDWALRARSSNGTVVRLVARAADAREGSVVHARRRSIRRSSTASPSRSATTTKAEVRSEAAAAGLAAARRPESQEACFLAGGDYRSFLSRQGLATRPGPIVDQTGDDRRTARRAVAVHARPASRDRRHVSRAALRAPVGRRGERARRRPTAAARRDASRRSRSRSTSTSTTSRRSFATAARPWRRGCQPRTRLLARAVRAGRGGRAGSDRRPLRQ